MNFSFALAFLFLLNLSYSGSSKAQEAGSSVDTLIQNVAPYVATGSFSGVLSYVCDSDAKPTTVPFGNCDREKNISCNTETKFRIGSMSKSFTSAAILKLVEDGQFSLDDPISKWLPEYPLEHLHLNGKQVLIRHLLSHQSGIPDWETTPLKDRAFTSTISLIDIMQSVSGLPLETEPGTAYHYSNTGYSLLALIVERTSGETYEYYIHQVILNPLKMNASGITLPAQIGLAKGYHKDGLGKWISFYDDSTFIDRDLNLLQGSGSIYSKASEIIDWMRGFGSGKIVSAPYVQAALKPTLGGYGFGWTAGRHLSNTPLYWHNGAVSPVGFSSQMGFATSINEKPGFAYTILTNIDRDDVSADALAQIYQHLVTECHL